MPFILLLVILVIGNKTGFILDDLEEPRRTYMYATIMIILLASFLLLAWAVGAIS